MGLKVCLKKIDLRQILGKIVGGLKTVNKEKFRGKRNVLHNESLRHDDILSSVQER